MHQIKRWVYFLFQAIVLTLVIIFLAGFKSSDPNDNLSSRIQHSLVTLSWSVAPWVPLFDSSMNIQQKSWNYWAESSANSWSPSDINLKIPTVSILQVLSDTNKGNKGDDQRICQFLEETYGMDWRERPLLLQGILQYNLQNRNTNESNLSLSGLLRNHLVIPYFENASQPGALSPTGQAPVSEIIQGMLKNKPYKIGSQLIVQENIQLLEELTGNRKNATTAPGLLTTLFGNHFTEKHLQQGRFIPATTTVPLFVAKTSPKTIHSDDDTAITTGLHCEPIGNVAFQIEGAKEWTLVAPEYSSLLQPSLAADGRAFYASSLSLGRGQTMTAMLFQNKIPHWNVVTKAGDALWLPTWMWHRVDYVHESTISQEEYSSCEQAVLAIGGSIFHFRPLDFVLRNPLYAVLIIPALLKELAGISTQ
jgi:hypothetical protein